MTVEGTLHLSLISLNVHFNRFYIVRDPKHFRIILDCLREGKLNQQEGMTKELLDELKHEFSFYKIPFVSLICEIPQNYCLIIVLDV